MMAFVIRRFYVHNFRCLENFQLPVSDLPSVLLIGKNGSGKTTVSRALEILQSIGRGANRVGELGKPKDFACGRTEVPISFEIEVVLKGKTYSYNIAFELPPNFKELRVLAEIFAVDGTPIYVRKMADVHLARAEKEKEAKFLIDWHMVALPIVQEQSSLDPLSIFKQWLAHMIILRPIPTLISGESQSETLKPDSRGTDFAAWFSGILAHAPSAYSKIDQYLKQVMPDLKDIKNPIVGTDARSLEVQFANEVGTIKLPFEDLSDGEKCFMICALVLAANDAYGPLLCFWDEPDNFLALSEVEHFVMALRKAFQSGGQFITTSHNSEAIRTFSDENTLLLYRKSHLEPTMVRPLSGLQYKGNLVDVIARGDLEP